MALEGQVAIVNGAGQGIGKAIAARFAAEGADVGIIDVNGQKAQATCEEIRRMGRWALAAVADVANVRAVEAAVGEIVGEIGRLDILVNNAGIEKRAPFLDHSGRLATTAGDVLLHAGGGTGDGEAELWTNPEHLLSRGPHRAD